MTPKEVLAFCRKKDVKAVDLRFTDVSGAWRHFTIPVDKLREELFEDGFGCDGSNLLGWLGTNDSDILLVPQPETCFVDPFAKPPTLVIICQVLDPIRREEYARNPRHIAHKAENYLLRTGIAEVANFGPEAEFFLFDRRSWKSLKRSGFPPVDRYGYPHPSGGGTQPDGDSIGQRPAAEDAASPADSSMDLRNEMVQCMIECGMDVESHRQDIRSPYKCCIDLRYQNLTKMADFLMMYKHIVKNVARRHAMIATFMPKPIHDDEGAGMHSHFSLWKQGEPLFAGKETAGLSPLGLYALGGILRHAPAVMAFTNSSTNSYRRLVPDLDHPPRLTFGQQNRSVACRIPQYSANPRMKRIEFRCPDSSCNPYLALTAILMAAIDGIQNKLTPPEPIDDDTRKLPADVLNQIPPVPSSLAESLTALGQDREFLLRGDVFSSETIDAWIQWKLRREVNPIRLYPHPFEFRLYFDA
jgi:glutamine synthetase